MAERDTNRRMEEELRRLALLPEDQIDTSDMPEVTDWSSARRAPFCRSKLNERSYDVRAIANWFLAAAHAAGRSITNLHLNKLVYFAVERALIERSLLLTPAKIEAWDHGPVFREIYHSVKDSRDRPIRIPIQKFSIVERKMVTASEEFLDEDTAYFRDIYAYYGGLSASQLRNLSHVQGQPWDVVWNHKTRTNFGMHISPEIILIKALPRRSQNGGN